MVNGPYYSDRQGDTQPCIKEDISPTAWGGIIAEINRRFDDNSFGHRFPLICPGTKLAYGCNQGSFVATLKSRIPNLQWPLNPNEVPNTLVVLDLLEFCHDVVGRVEEAVDPQTLKKPIQGLGNIFPDELCHIHLKFSINEGQGAFRNEINCIFFRNGIAYELNAEGQVIRLGPEPLRSTLTSATFNTGDANLDSLLESARSKYLNPDPNTRKEALEKLWDAWERLKTIEPGSDKKESAKRILDRAASEIKFREVLENEAITLTSIGNDFQIRHFETNRVPLTEDQHVDYLFYRMFSLVWLLLRATNRGG